mgnify:CR=1 FL=1
MAAQILASLAFLLACAAAIAQSPDGQPFSAAQIKHGGQIYSQNCAPCHGPRMLDPNAAFDLRKFPPDQKSRFVTSIVKGKNQMPPWGDLLKAEDIDALWAYVIAGEKE